MILGRQARASAWWDNVLADFAIMLDIRHLQISYNTPCLPPPPPKFSITFVFHFSWVLQPSQEKLKTCKVFWGGAGGRVGGKQGALWEICKCSPIFSSSHTFSITCSRSLFVSPCPPECYFQSETKIEPDLRLGEWLEYSKMPPNHFAGLVCACLLANVNHSRVFE